MRDFANLSVRLFVFALIAGLLLGATNAITAGPIAEQKAQAANASRIALFPNADDFQSVDGINLSKYSGVTEVYKAYSQGDLSGYAISMAPQGYKAVIDMTVGIGVNGAVKGVVINSQSETAGLGSKIANAPFLGQFTGVAASPDSIAGSVDTITGATVSSRTVRNAVATATQLGLDEFSVVPEEAKPLTDEDKPRLTTLPNAEGFDDVSLLSFLGDYSSVKEVKAAYKGSEMIGYSFSLEAEGFGGTIPIIMGLDINANAITGITIGENNESDGYGARVNEPEYQAQYAGLPLEVSALDNVEDIEGAGVTSSAIKNSVAQAISFYHKYLEARPFEDGLSDADSFQDVAIPAECTRVTSAKAALKSGAVVGYRLEGQDISREGNEPIKLAVSIIDGKYATISVISHNETAGKGGNLLSGEYLDRFIGRDADPALFDGMDIDAKSSATTKAEEPAPEPTAADNVELAPAAVDTETAVDAESTATKKVEPETDGGIDAVSGATLTSNAVMRILKECAQVVRAAQ